MLSELIWCCPFCGILHQSWASKSRVDGTEECGMREKQFLRSDSGDGDGKGGNNAKTIGQPDERMRNGTIFCAADDSNRSSCEIKIAQMTVISRVCSASYSFYWITLKRCVATSIEHWASPVFVMQFLLVCLFRCRRERAYRVGMRFLHFKNCTQQLSEHKARREKKNWNGLVTTTTTTTNDDRQWQTSSSIAKRKPNDRTTRNHTGKWKALALSCSLCYFFYDFKECMSSYRFWVKGAPVPCCVHSNCRAMCAAAAAKKAISIISFTVRVRMQYASTAPCVLFIPHVPSTHSHNAIT